jgi:hypothetical protein
VANIFGAEIPAVVNANDSTAYTMGTGFSASADGTITAARWYFPSTLPTATVSGGLFRNSDQALLGMTTFSSPTAGAWNEATYSSAIPITGGTAYTAVIWTPDHYVATTSYAFPKTSGQLTATDGRFGTSASPFAYPGSNFNASYFVDVEFSPAGGPTPQAFTVAAKSHVSFAQSARIAVTSVFAAKTHLAFAASGGQVSAGGNGMQGWFQLVDIQRVNRDDYAALVALGPQACPLCGTPLDINARTGRRGCPNDGWKWTGSNWRP